MKLEQKLENLFDARKKLFAKYGMDEIYTEVDELKKKSA